MKQPLICRDSFATRAWPRKRAVGCLYKTDSKSHAAIDVRAISCCIGWFFALWHMSCFIELVPTQGRVSAQTNRKQCGIAKGSVKFRNLTEEQESRRTRKESWLDNNNKPLGAFGRNAQQPGRILETVNSDNKKI